jgi:hypothetical protein
MKTEGTKTDDAKELPPPKEEMFACECGKPIGWSEPKCRHCGFDYIAFEATLDARG